MGWCVHLRSVTVELGDGLIRRMESINFFLFHGVALPGILAGRSSIIRGYHRDGEATIDFSFFS